LEMLIEVDRICKKCGIKYCIVAGTLLGSVRHGGYIPWDDDADVSMLRPEYEKFREACKTELDTERFYFQDYKNTPGYRWGYGKLRRKGTEFVRLNQEHMPYEQGIFIDVFPYDNVPDNYLLRCIHNFHCFVYRKIFWSAVGRKSEKLILRLIYSILYKIPEKKLYERYEKFIEKSNRKKGKLIRVLTFPTPNRVFGYDRRWWEDLSDKVFEGYIFKGARDYDGYLSFKYGDYMTLPPVEKRKVHPVSKLKLVENDLIREKLSGGAKNDVKSEIYI